jgi:hypothetical protein
MPWSPGAPKAIAGCPSKVRAVPLPPAAGRTAHHHRARETVTGVVTGLAAEPVSMLEVAVALVSVVVGFGAWWTYFDFAGDREPQQTPTATLRWVLAHLPPTAAVAAAMVSLAGLPPQQVRLLPGETPRIEVKDS